MSLSRTLRRRRGDTSAKRREEKIDHRVNCYVFTEKFKKWAKSRGLSWR